MHCNKAIRIIARKIQKQGYNVKISNKSLKNLVGCIYYGSKIDLPALTKLICIKASFEPEIFPGLIFTIEKCKATIFKSGKINITGGKTIKELNSAFDFIFEYLFQLYLESL